MKDQEESSSKNRRRSILIFADAVQIQVNEDDESKWGGSSEGCKYKPRDQEIMNQRLKLQYFTTLCRYEEDVF